MFKISLFYSVFIFCSLSGFCQTLTVKYDSTLFDELDQYGNTFFDNGLLVASKDYSIYTIIPKDTIIESDIFGSRQYSHNDYTTVYFKDFREGLVIYEEDRASSTGKPNLIKDNTYRIEWQLNDVRKKVLGYDVQEATGRFRGREYKVYFAPELLISSGPFKFDGLPGIILEVVSLDGAVRIIAKEIFTSSEIVTYPFDKSRETISWEQFKSSYKRYFESMIAYKPSPDSQISVPNRDIEYFVD